MHAGVAGLGVQKARLKSDNGTEVPIEPRLNAFDGTACPEAGQAAQQCSPSLHPDVKTRDGSNYVSNVTAEQKLGTLEWRPNGLN